MKDRDLLTELRAWRDEFARSHGYDLEAMAATLKRIEVAYADRLVRGEPRTPTTPTHLGQRLTTRDDGPRSEVS